MKYTTLSAGIVGLTRPASLHGPTGPYGPMAYGQGISAHAPTKQDHRGLGESAGFKPNSNLPVQVQQARRGGAGRESCTHPGPRRRPNNWFTPWVGHKAKLLLDDDRGASDNNWVAVRCGFITNWRQ